LTEEVANRLVESSYWLSTAEQRLIQYAIGQCVAAQQPLSIWTHVEVVADVFAAQFPCAVQGDAYLELKKALESLFERFVTVYDQDPESNEARITTMRWIGSASYLDDVRTVGFTLVPAVIQYHERLKEALAHPKLDKFAGLSSIYAVRLYALLQRQQGIHEFSRGQVRDLLEIMPKEYKLTADLKKWVLDVAIAQINQHSDVNIECEPKKTGRTITHFVFTVNPKPMPGAGEDQAYRDRLEANGQKRLDEA
jgi:hypothetical protein